MLQNRHMILHDLRKCQLFRENSRKNRTFFRGSRINKKVAKEECDRTLRARLLPDLPATCHPICKCPSVDRASHCKWLNTKVSHSMLPSALQISKGVGGCLISSAIRSTTNDQHLRLGTRCHTNTTRCNAPHELGTQCHTNNFHKWKSSQATTAKS